MAADVVFVVNPPGWNHAFKSNTGMLGTFIRQKTNDVEAAIRSAAPGPGTAPRNRTGINYGTGVLKAGIVSRMTVLDGDPEGRVIALPEHAKYLIHGTRGPYVIRPKNPGGRLRFFWHRMGTFVSFRQVTHPGIMANDFMMRGLRRGMSRLL